MITTFRLTIRAALIAGLACAAVASPASAQAGPAPYLLGVQDKLRITVFQREDLSGEFIIGPSGTISFPLVGEVVAAGRRTDEVAAALSEGLKAKGRLVEAPSTSVEILEFRPIYVLGDVQTPGEYAFRPGMMVINAVTLAGGEFRLAGTELLRLERDSISSRGTLVTLGQQVREYLARLARLEAEKEGRDTVGFPPELMERQDDPAVRRLMEEERLIMEVRRKAIAEEIANLQGFIELLNEEIEVRTAQIEAQGAELEAAEAELEDIRSLVAKGLAPTPRLLTAQRTAADIRQERQELQTAILRARQSITETETRILRLGTDREQEIVQELLDTKSKLQAARSEMETAERLLYEAEILAPRALTEERNRDATGAEFTIVRRRGERVEEIEATEVDLIAPGDVVRVRKLLELTETAQSRPNDLAGPIAP